MKTAIKVTCTATKKKKLYLEIWKRELLENYYRTTVNLAHSSLKKKKHSLLLTLALMAEMALLCILLLHTQKITLPQHTTPPVNLQLNWYATHLEPTDESLTLFSISVLPLFSFCIPYFLSLSPYFFVWFPFSVSLFFFFFLGVKLFFCSLQAV